MARFRISFPGLRRLLFYLLLFSFLWAVVSGNQGWEIGVLAIVAATVTVLFYPVQLLQVRPLKFLSFSIFFFYSSLQSALAVTRIAFHPALPLYPFWMTYRFHLPAGPSRTLFVAIISLLPGTLSADMEENFIRVHTIGADSTATRERLALQLYMLEQRIAKAFGQTVSGDRGEVQREYGL